jgi:phosphoserine phosphatase RsbU/P
MASSFQTDSMKMVLLSGPSELEPIVITLDSSCTIGRSSTCDVVLDDPRSSLSRSHIRAESLNGSWTISDLGSRNGTTLNGSKLIPDLPTPIQSGDTVQFGAWKFRIFGVHDDQPNNHEISSTMVHTLNDSSTSTHMVELVNDEPLANLASHRLAVLLDCADQIHRADNLQAASKIALHAMIESTGFARAAYLVPQRAPNEYETLAFESKNQLIDVSDVHFSQSLLEAAEKGEVVRLSTSGSIGDYGQSIAELDIHSALCIPVHDNSEVVGFIYLDARGSESSIHHDASAFGRAVGRLLGLTASNLHSQELRIQQMAMQFDLDAAANAQKLLLPPESGQVGLVSYSMLMRPGRMVAGDLFGVVELDQGRVCAFLGDVSGKGAGSAIMMATTQSFIHAMLDQTTDLSTIVTKLNKHIADRSSGQFVTMWIGIIHTQDSDQFGEVEFIDAGHGHWLVTQGENHAHRPEYTGSLVIGINPVLEYQSERFRTQRGQRLVLFSDGIVEQTAPNSDEEYSIERAIALISQSSSHAEDVSLLLQDVLSYAQSDQLKDDTTIASLGIQ